MVHQDLLGPDDIEPVAGLASEWARVVEAVVMVKRSRPGTGILIAGDRVLTAHHVVPDEDALERAVVTLGMRAGDRAARLTVRSSAFFCTSEALDYTVFGVEPVGGATPLDLAAAVRPKVGEHVRVFGHRHGRPLEVSGPEGTVQSIDEPFVEYTADTEDGMSGGPVLRAPSQPIALHHFGDHDRDFSNRGVLLTAIREDLRRCSEKR